MHTVMSLLEIGIPETEKADEAKKGERWMVIVSCIKVKEFDAQSHEMIRDTAVVVDVFSWTLKSHMETLCIASN